MATRSNDGQSVGLIGPMVIGLAALRCHLSKGNQARRVIRNASALWEFAHLLQEYRIALFAPEVKTGQKVSAKRLERFWDERCLGSGARD
jgi:hypothetical protein